MADERSPKKAVDKTGKESKSVPAASGGLLGLQDVEVDITLEWGRTSITLEEAMHLGENASLKVDQLAGEPVEVRVNGKLFGRGIVVMVGDNYGVQLTEIIDPAVF